MKQKIKNPKKEIIKLKNSYNEVIRAYRAYILQNKKQEKYERQLHLETIRNYRSQQKWFRQQIFILQKARVTQWLFNLIFMIKKQINF